MPEDEVVAAITCKNYTEEHGEKDVENNEEEMVNNDDEVEIVMTENASCAIVANTNYLETTPPTTTTSVDVFLPDATDDQHVHHTHSVAYSVGSKFVEVRLMNNKNNNNDDDNNHDFRAVRPIMAEVDETYAIESDTSSRTKGRMIASDKGVRVDGDGGNAENRISHSCGDNGGDENTTIVKLNVIEEVSDSSSNKNASSPSPQQQHQCTARTFLECITGSSSSSRDDAKGGGGESSGSRSGCDRTNDLLLCGSSFPDDICALLWSHPASSRSADVETMDNGTTNNNHDTKKEEVEEDQQQHQIHRKKRDRHRRTNSIKRARVDARSLPDLPAPIEIPQIFIKRDDARGGDGYDETTSHHTDMSIDEGKDATRQQPEQEVEKKKDGVEQIVQPVSANTRPPIYLRSKSATAATYRNNKALSSRGVEPGRMIVPACSTRTLIPPTHLLQRGRSLQSFPQTLDSALPLAFSLSLQRQQSRRGVEEELNVVSSSSSDANLSTNDNDDDNADVDARVGDVGGGNNSNTTPAIASLTSFYRERYLALCEEGIFHIRFLDTYQGRNPNSTNGCTVIAPLMCVQYFTSYPSDHDAQQVQKHEYNDASVFPWNDGIPDELINHVIDDQAAAILIEVRNKLNLEQDAFIIPSDVHDHFITDGLLSTSQFVGVCGGNILDDLHVQVLKSALLASAYDMGEESVRWKNRRIAATLFFHGHVIALHVVKSGGGGGNNGHFSIELIDSLPDPETWLKRTNHRLMSMSSNSSSNCNDIERVSLIQWRSEEVDDVWERPMEYNGCGADYDELPRNAIRVRCTDVEQFDTLIRHYACSKFTMEEQHYIDKTVWEDNSGYCEESFDPRVFQAFIWAEAV